MLLGLMLPAYLGPAGFLSPTKRWKCSEEEYNKGGLYPTESEQQDLECLLKTVPLAQAIERIHCGELPEVHLLIENLGDE